HRQRVVVDDRDAGASDGGGLRAASAHDHDGREGAGATRELDARREARTPALVGDVHRDGAAGDRPGDTCRLSWLLAVDISLGQLLDLFPPAPVLRGAGDHGIAFGGGAFVRPGYCPSAWITRRAAGAPEYCCCPVISRPSRSANGLNR